MKQLEIINVGNGTKEYPGNFTKKENEIIQDAITGTSLHLFSGRSTVGDVRIDYSCVEATINLDVFEYIKIKSGYFDTIILDAPYNRKFADKYNKECNIDEDQFIIFAQSKKTTELFNFIKMKQPQRIIIKSWNYYVPAGYDLIKGYCCYAGGYRKPTFLLILNKD